jgi:GAF domain-containing protein
MILEQVENKTEQLQKLLLQGIELAGADLGNIQLYNSEKQTLEIVAHSGFTREFLDVFKKVTAFDPTACGRAFGVGVPVMINDVTMEKSFAPFVSTAKAAGFRAVLSVPLFSPDEKTIGVISVHFKGTQQLSGKTRILPEKFLKAVAHALLEMSAAA